MKNNKHISYIHFQSIDSTNTWAKSNASILDPSQITCITAQEQTAGRGRFQRKWISPKGVNLYATFYFCIPKDSAFIPNLGQLLSISCCKLLNDLGFSPQIKWPNDILLEEKKVAGILCETTPEKDLLGIVLGIGININMEDEMMQDIDQPATSLKKISKQEWSIEKLLKKLSIYFLEDLQSLETDGFEPFKTFYEHHLAFKDKQVSIRDGSQLLTGICQGVSKNGNLILSSSEGQIEIFAGSIISH